MLTVPVERDPLDALIDAYGNDFSRLEAALADRKRQYRKATERPRRDGPVVLDASGLMKTYKSGRNSVQAVSQVGFQVREGEMVALTGPSGSGKSTVLNLLSGLDRPDEGSIRIGDTDITKLSRNKMASFRCQNVGFVFQFFYLQPFLNVARNVGVPAMFMDEEHRSIKQREKAATKLVGAVGLEDRALHLPKELSGGQMQRVAIARALINQPKLVLADEPTGNLDSENAQGIMDLFDQIRSRYGTAIVLVTHDQKIAGAADRTIEMIDGRVA